MPIPNEVRRRGIRKTHVYDIDEWEMSVLLRSMNVSQRGQFFQLAAADDDDDNSNIHRFVFDACVLDPETNDPMFTDDDLDWLMTEADPDVVVALSNECMRLSGLSKKAADEVGKDSPPPSPDSENPQT